MTTQNHQDKALTLSDMPVRRLEVAAMEAYRKRHPDGPVWQDLQSDTRAMWMTYTEKNNMKGGDL